MKKLLTFKIKDFYVFIILNILIILFYINVGLTEDFLFFFTNYIICFMSIFGLLYNSNQYFSLSKMFFLFNLIFFGIVPYLDNVNNTYYWDGNKIEYIYFIIANIFIIIHLIIFLLINITISAKCININKFKDNKKGNKDNFILSLFLVMLSIVSSYFILLKYDYNFLSILVRGTIEEIYKVSKSEGLIFNHVIRPLPAISLLLYKYFLL